MRPTKTLFGVFVLLILAALVVLAMAQSQGLFDRPKATGYIEYQHGLMVNGHDMPITVANTSAEWQQQTAYYGES